MRTVLWKWKYKVLNRSFKILFVHDCKHMKQSMPLSYERRRRITLIGTVEIIF